MAYGYWIKVYHDILDDHKVGMLPDATKWRFIACLIMAGEAREDGFLPSLEEMSFRLRPISETELEGDLSLMARRGLVELRQHEDGTERWFVTHFGERQSAMTHAERQKRYRNADRNVTVTERDTSVTNRVTKRHTDIDIDIDIDEREIERERGGLAPAPPPPLPTAEPDDLSNLYRDNHPALQVYSEVTGFWPGQQNADLLVKGLGDNPNRRALEQAVKLWRGSGYKATNIVGLLDWYRELCRNPNWSPADRFKRKGNQPPPRPTENVIPPEWMDVVKR